MCQDIETDGLYILPISSFTSNGHDFHVIYSPIVCFLFMYGIFFTHFEFNT